MELGPTATSGEAGSGFAAVSTLCCNTGSGSGGVGYIQSSCKQLVSAEHSTIVVMRCDNDYIAECGSNRCCGLVKCRILVASPEVPSHRLLCVRIFLLCKLQVCAAQQQQVLDYDGRCVFMANGGTANSVNWIGLDGCNLQELNKLVSYAIANCLQFMNSGRLGILFFYRVTFDFTKLRHVT